NKALRREILAYTTDGIAQSIIKAKLLSKKTKYDIKSLPSFAYYPNSLNDTNTLSTTRFFVKIIHNYELLYGTSNNDNRKVNKNLITYSSRQSILSDILQEIDDGKYNEDILYSKTFDQEEFTNKNI